MTLHGEMAYRDSWPSVTGKALEWCVTRCRRPRAIQRTIGPFCQPTGPFCKPTGPFCRRGTYISGIVAQESCNMCYITCIKTKTISVYEHICFINKCNLLTHDHILQISIFFFLNSIGDFQ